MDTEIKLRHSIVEQRSCQQRKHKRDSHSNSNSNSNSFTICNNNSITNKSHKSDGQQVSSIAINNKDNNSADNHSKDKLKSIKSKKEKERHKKVSKGSNQKNNNLNDLSINSNNGSNLEKCNNKKNKSKNSSNHKLKCGNNSSNNNKYNKTDKCDKNKDNSHSSSVKTKDQLNINSINNKNINNSNNELCLTKGETNCFIKEFKFFKEKAKDKLKKSISLTTSKSKTTNSSCNTSCGSSHSKHDSKSGDLLSGSCVKSKSDSNCGKHNNKETSNKSKVIGLKNVKQLNEDIVKEDNCNGSKNSGHNTCSATSSGNTSCDHKIIKVKTSAKTNKYCNTKYNNISDNSNNNKNDITTNINNKTNSSLNKSQSKSPKNKTSDKQTKDKCLKTNGKRINKVKDNLIIKDNLLYDLYDEDIIDGFAIFSFKNIQDLELTINKRCGQLNKSDDKEKHIKDDTLITSTDCPSFSSSSSPTLSSQLKSSNKISDEKSPKVSASKHSKNASKEVKSVDKSDDKNVFNSSIGKISKKKQNENKGNKNKNNKNGNNNQHKHKSNNKLNPSKNDSQLSTILTNNKKTSIKPNKGEVSNNKRDDSETEDNNDKISEEGSDFSNSTFGSLNKKEITSTSLTRHNCLSESSCVEPTRITSLQSPSVSSNNTLFTTSLSSTSVANKVISNSENSCAKLSSDPNSNNKDNSDSSEPSDSSKENKSISFTSLTTSLIASSQKSPSIGVNNNSNAYNLSISDDKVYSLKNLSSVSNDSSFSSSSTSCSSSSVTLPLNSCNENCESVPFLSHNLISLNSKDSKDTETSTNCLSSVSPIVKTSRVSTPPLLPPPIPPPLIPNITSNITNSNSCVSSKSTTQYSRTESTYSLATDHQSVSQQSDVFVFKNKEKSIKSHGSVSFQSHFIESVLRNNSTSDQCNALNSKDNINRTNICYSPPVVDKVENNSIISNKKSISTQNSKLSSRSPRTTSPSNKSLNNNNNNSLSNLYNISSNSTKSIVKESLSQPKCGIKRTASPPLTSNQSTITPNKHVRQSSPNHIHHFDSLNSPLHPRASTPSIRSNSNSLSSLSQLSQSIGGNFNNTKERDRDRDRDRERDRERESASSVGTASNKSCNSSRNTPSIITGVSNSSSVDNITFSANFNPNKSHLWSSSSSIPISSGGLTSSAISHLTSQSVAPRVSTPNIVLSSSLHNNHLGMFASPIPPNTLSSVGGAVAPSATPSPFIGDSLFSHQNQDFLRRELDTRFLASQDRTINIPPPPYMRAEMHQHIHLPQSQPFAMPNAMTSSLVQPSNPHLYDKFPKLDQAFYGRSALGLPGFPSLSPLLTPGGSSTTPQSGGLTASSSTPFGPPGHLAAFQPKMNSLSNKSKPSAKSGRWCAMHVRIAWEIYHHQQKQQQLDLSLKSGVSSSLTNNSSKSISSTVDMLRPLNHLFSSRNHEMPPFSSALMSAASSRASFESQLPQHHNQFGSTTASPHLSGGTSNFTRFPGFGGFGSLGSPLNMPSGPTPPTSSALFGPAAISGARDLPIPGCLPGLSASVPDMWSRNQSTRVNSALFPPLTTSTSSSSSNNSSSWGGLKAEAERDRLHEELYNKRKHSDSIDKDPKRFEKDKSKNEEKTDIKHKDHSHKHSSSSSSSSHINTHLRNGDIYSEQKNKEWVKSINKRESSRSPIHHSHHSHQSHASHSSSHQSLHHNHHHNHSHSAKISKTEISAFDNNNKISSVDVKEEQKEENNLINQQSDRERHNKTIIDPGNEVHIKTTAVPTLPTSSASNLLNSSATLAAMSLNNPLERARLMGLFGLHGTPPPVSPHLSGNNPNDSLRSYWSPLLQPVNDPFKSLHDFQVRSDFLDRDNIFQRYSLLNSSGGGASLIEKIAKENAEKEMLNHSIEKHNSKLIGTQLRSNESSFSTGLPPHTHHNPHSHPSHLPQSQPPTPSSSSSTSNLFPANQYLNSLHSLSTTAGSYIRNSKTSTPVQTSSSSSSSSEPSSPSLAAINGTTLPTLIPNVLNHSSNLTNSKMSIGSLVETPLEAIKEMSNKNSENNSTLVSSNRTNSNRDNTGIEIRESNSR